MVFYHDLPETHQFVRLCVVLMHCFQTPIFPMTAVVTFGVPKSYQYIQCFLYQSAYFEIALLQTLECFDECGIES